MIRWLSRMLLLFATGLAVWAGYLFLVPTMPSGLELHVEQPQRDLGAQSVGKVPLVFSVANPSARTVRFSAPPFG